MNSSTLDVVPLDLKPTSCMPLIHSTNNDLKGQNITMNSLTQKGGLEAFTITSHKMVG